MKSTESCVVWVRWGDCASSWSPSVKDSRVEVSEDREYQARNAPGVRGHRGAFLKDRDVGWAHRDTTPILPWVDGPVDVLQPGIAVNVV